jgi:hypothetical protein
LLAIPVGNRVKLGTLIFRRNDLGYWVKLMKRQDSVKILYILYIYIVRKQTWDVN